MFAFGLPAVDSTGVRTMYLPKFLKRMVARSSSMNAVMGDVVFETQPVKGQFGSSSLQWRVKNGLDGKGGYIGLKLLPDTYAGPDGAVRNYINFDIETAETIKQDLEACIAEYHRRNHSGF